MGSGPADSHAHVWRGPLDFISGARHRPNYDAPVETYIGHLDRHGLAKGLLIQPSFLGTDNAVMLDAVRQYPRRLKAVVVLDPVTPEEKLIALEGQGAVGVRYNLMGLPLPDFSKEPHAGFLRRLADRKWHVEIHREAHDLRALLEPLLACGVRVAVDHFGRPDPAGPSSAPGFRDLLAMGASRQVWVKVSAAYRCGGNAAALALTPMLLDHFDPERLLWGSDWPHTQHEAGVDYDSTFRLFERSVPDAAIRKRILEKAPEELLLGASGTP